MREDSIKSHLGGGGVLGLGLGCGGRRGGGGEGGGGGGGGGRRGNTEINEFHTQIPTNALQTYLTAQGFRKKYIALSLPHH